MMEMSQAIELLRKRENSIADDREAEALLEEAAEYIRNYTHLEEVPQGLERLWISMAARMASGKVSEIYEGDTKVKFQEGTQRDWQAQMNRYRKRCL